MCKEVNGWSNYPTWNWNLHNDGDYWSEIAQEIYDNSEENNYSTRKEVATIELSKRLESECENEFESTFTEIKGAFGDIFGWALGNIDFYEIAQNLMQDVEEDTEEEMEDENDE